MIQLNLLPELKREYLHSQQMKHTVIVASALISLVSVGLLVLFFMYVQVLQPQHRKDLQKDIDGGISQLKNQKDAVKIVTVQGALEQLPKLQNKKQITSRLFGYLNSFTPRGLSYSEVKLDLSTGTFSLTGNAQAYEQANVLANNLKSAQLTYTQNGTQQTIKPFTNIVFANLSNDAESTKGLPISFQLGFSTNSILFNQAITNASLKVNASSEQLLLPSSGLFSETSGGKQ